MEIVSALRKDDGWPSKYSSIMADARIMLSNFQSWNVSFVRREGNEAAHKLAQLAVKQHLHHVWIGTWPSCLSGIVWKDQCNFINYKIPENLQKKKKKQDFHDHGLHKCSNKVPTKRKLQFGTHKGSGC